MTIRNTVFPLWLVLVSFGEYWEVRFAAHPENVGVVVTTSCRGEEPVSAYTWVDVSASDTRARLRKVLVPVKATCRYAAHVMRQGADDGPGVSYVGESGGL